MEVVIQKTKDSILSKMKEKNINTNPRISVKWKKKYWSKELEKQEKKISQEITFEQEWNLQYRKKIFYSFQNER